MSNATDKTMKLRQSAADEIKRIQTNSDLTGAAKAHRIAVIREKTNTEIGKLKASHEKERVNTRDALHRRLFGLGYAATATEAEKQVTQMNYRDALFKADSIKSQTEALRALGRARMVGDKQLAKAIARVAFEQQWDGVLNEYASESDAIQSNLQELINFEQGLGNNQARMTESMAFSLIPETQEEIQARLSGQSVGG